MLRIVHFVLYKLIKNLERMWIFSNPSLSDIFEGVDRRVKLVAGEKSDEQLNIQTPGILSHNLATSQGTSSLEAVFVS